MGSQDVRIAGYDELRPIGRGGFGVVYQARDGRFARDVAIKVLNGVLDDTMTARFERECHAVGALSGHPHIVVVHASGTTDEGVLFLVMELLSGGSLADRLASAGPQAWPLAAELGVQLGGALETAHRGGVLHRDVKPENVLLSAYRQPKLVDFGIATVLGGFETKSSSISASLAHAAPEILAGKRASAASDVYALGSTLFQVLTGHPAFHDDDDETLYPMLARISSATVPDLRTRGVPDAVASVVERAMAKQPEDRYDTALAFATALQQAAVVSGQVVSGPVVIGHEQAEPPPASTSEPTFVGAVTPALGKPDLLAPAHATAALAPTPAPPAAVPSPRPPRRRGLLVSAVAITAALAVGAGVLLTREDSTPPTTPVAGESSVYRFAQAKDSTVRSTRTWALDASGRVLSNDTVLVNTSAAPIRRVAVEIIPKSVAEDVHDVDFATPGFEIVETDPVVSYTLTLAPKREVHLRWSVQLREPIDLTVLKRLAKDQRDAEKAAAPTRAAIVRSTGLPAAALVPFPSAVDPGVATVIPTATATATRPAPVVVPTLPDPDSTSPAPTDPVVIPPTPSAQPTTAPPSPALKPPSAPRGIVIGYVQVVSYKGGDPNAESASVSVKLSWVAPAAGGAPTGYCVRWTVFAGSAAAGSPSTPACVTGRETRITVPHVNPADSWLKWEVRAFNKAGPSGWQHGLSVIPDLVGTRQSSGYDKLRAAGLRVRANAEVPDDTYSCIITQQSPRSGTVTPATYVTITWKQCPP